MLLADLDASRLFVAGRTGGMTLTKGIKRASVGLLVAGLVKFDL